MKKSLWIALSGLAALSVALVLFSLLRPRDDQNASPQPQIATTRKPAVPAPEKPIQEQVAPTKKPPLIAKNPSIRPETPIASGKVLWRSSFREALDEAKSTGKPIFVDFFTTWCGPCKYLDAVTYKDASFVAESKRWVMVKIDAEKDNTNAELALKFRIDGFPSMIFLGSDGTESDRVVGGYPPEELVPKMKQAGQKAGGGKSI